MLSLFIKNMLLDEINMMRLFGVPQGFIQLYFKTYYDIDISQLMGSEIDRTSKCSVYGDAKNESPTPVLASMDSGTH